MEAGDEALGGDKVTGLMHRDLILHLFRHFLPFLRKLRILRVVRAVLRRVRRLRSLRSLWQIGGPRWSEVPAPPDPEVLARPALFRNNLKLCE